MIDTSYVLLFLLIMVRMTSFFVTAPIFSSKGVPTTFKLGLGFFVSLLVFPIVANTNYAPGLNAMFYFYLLQEAIFGLALGWVSQLLFTSIQIAGSFIDMQIGFAIANVIDPQTGAQSPLMGNFKYIFAVLLFLSMDAHHLLIEGVISSYHLLPIDEQWLAQISNQATIDFIVTTFTKMFIIAFQIAAPFVGTLFLTDVALGIVARTVPQLNVFVVGMPLKVLVHFILLLVVTPGIFFMFQYLFKEIIISMKQFIDLMGL